MIYDSILKDNHHFPIDPTANNVLIGLTSIWVHLKNIIINQNIYFLISYTTITEMNDLLIL